jgi:hypothetical protein
MNDKFCLKLIEKYLELVNSTQALSKEYEISTKYLEEAINQIKILKLELVTVAARQAEILTQSKGPQ